MSIRRTVLVAFSLVLVGVLILLLFRHFAPTPPLLPGAPGERVVHFPKDRSMGVLLLCDSDAADLGEWEEFCEARGSVAVPAGKELMLEAFVPLLTRYRKLMWKAGLWKPPQPVYDLSPLGSLAPGDLQGLYVMAPSQISDADLVHLKGLTSLRALALFSTSISDAGLAHLARLTSLERLALYKIPITDAGLAHLEQLKALRTLSLNGTAITGPGLASLEGFRSLEYLDLSRTRIDDAALSHLKRLTELKQLRLWQTRVGDAGLRHLRQMQSLQHLDLSMTDITDAGLDHLAGLTSLQRLVIPEQISDTALDELKKAFPKCDIRRR